MLDVGVIRPSNSPGVSAVVLVQKKDGKLTFCIDLQRLHAHTIKDACSLPRFEETLDCLNGAVWFTSLDLKLGYLQVEMDIDCKALTAFIAGPLGFYELGRMLFGILNVPTTFQHLMQSCLGNFHLLYCIIYLDGLIVFSKITKKCLVRCRAILQKIWKAE